LLNESTNFSINVFLCGGNVIFCEGDVGVGGPKYTNATDFSLYGSKNLPFKFIRPIVISALLLLIIGEGRIRALINFISVSLTVN
jgi:hypothetical protein